MRTPKQKQIIAHKRKLDKILRSREPQLIKLCLIMDLLTQLREDSASMDTCEAMAKTILTSRTIKMID